MSMLAMRLLHNLKPVQLVGGLHRLVVQGAEVVAVQLQGGLLPLGLLVLKVNLTAEHRLGHRLERHVGMGV